MQGHLEHEEAECLPHFTLPLLVLLWQNASTEKINFMDIYEVMHGQVEKLA